MRTSPDSARMLIRDGCRGVMADKLREERLGLWDQLLRGMWVNAPATERAFARLIRSVGGEERERAVLVLAAAHVAWKGRKATRRTLIAALRYWWSKSGSKDRPQGFAPRDLDGGGVLEVMGLDLTWEEALRSVGVRKVDHKALHRLQAQLEDAYTGVWERLLGSAPPMLTNDTDGRR